MEKVKSNMLHIYLVFLLYRLWKAFHLAMCSFISNIYSIIIPSSNQSCWKSNCASCVEVFLTVYQVVDDVGSLWGKGMFGCSCLKQKIKSLFKMGKNKQSIYRGSQTVHLTSITNNCSFPLK